MCTFPSEIPGTETASLTPAALESVHEDQVTCLLCLNLEFSSQLSCL